MRKTTLRFCDVETVLDKSVGYIIPNTESKQVEGRISCRWIRGLMIPPKYSREQTTSPLATWNLFPGIAWRIQELSNLPLNLPDRGERATLSRAGWLAGLWWRVVCVCGVVSQPLRARARKSSQSVLVVSVVRVVAGRVLAQSLPRTALDEFVARTNSLWVTHCWFDYSCGVG